MVICCWERIENRGRTSDGRVYWATAFAVSERISKKRRNRSQVQGSRFRVKEKEGIKDPKSSLNSLSVIAN